MPAKKGKSAAAKKRSIARRFNDSLTHRTPRVAGEKALDKRTAKRLERYRKELKDGKKGDKDLTALDIASRINDLLAYGDRMTDLKKLLKPRQVEYNEDVLVGVLKEMHPVYGFRAEAYRFAGVKDQAMVKAGVLAKMPARRGPIPGKKKAAKPAAKKKGRRKAKK